MVSRFGSAVPATSPVRIRSLPNWLAAVLRQQGWQRSILNIDVQAVSARRGRAQPPFRGNAPATCGAVRRLARVTFSTFKRPNFCVRKLRSVRARGLGPRTRHKCRFVPRSSTGSARGEHATVTWLRDGEATMAGFDMPSDDTACTSARQCPVCRGPMQVVGVESGVPGLRPDLRRQMIKCSACELVAVHTFALEQER
jgi:hypothetical protein